MNPAWYPVIGTLVIQLLGAAIVYGALGEKVRTLEKKVEEHDRIFDRYGNRINRLERHVGL